MCWSMSRYKEENYITVGYWVAKANVIAWWPGMSTLCILKYEFVSSVDPLVAITVGLMWSHNIMNFVICII